MTNPSTQSFMQKNQIRQLAKSILFFVLLLTFLNSKIASGQTLISPTGEGGFENGASFAANNWTAVNDLNSKWYVGTFVKSAGVNGAYIDVNGTAGAANNYNSAAIRISHIYKDVTIPAGATNIVLSFKWRANGENGTGADDYDFLRAFLVNTSVTPVANALLPSANIIGTGKYNLQGATVQTATITLSNALAGTSQRLVFTWKNDNSVTNNPGAALDEVSLTYTPGSACTGTPAPGNTIASSNPICSGSTVNLSLQNSTPGTGVTYQWQSSANGVTYANVAGTTATYSSVITASTYFRCLVTCSSSTGTSNPVQVTLSPFYNCVCPPSYTNSCSFDYISNVNFAGINNTTTCSGSTPANLTTYSAPNPSITGGLSYPISVTTDGSDEGVNVWIDYNMNGTFETTESVLSGFVAGAPQTYTGSVTVPLTVTSGQTKMRVRCRYNGAVTDPCVNYAYGETEDYLITLVAPPPCLTPTVGGTITGATTICTGISNSYSLSGGNGTVQWQISTSSASGPYEDVSGATSATLNYTAPGFGTYYMRTKHFILGCVDAFSNVLTISSNPPVFTSATASAAAVCPSAPVTLNATSNVAYSNFNDLAIPDFVTTNGIANSPIVISGFSPATITTATVKSVNFNINHTYVGDLRLRLFSPSGTVVTLVEQAGSSGDNFVNTTIVSSGGANGNVSLGTAPFTGTYNSQVAFSGLTGATNGTWVLRAVDLTGGDTGTILDWTLTLESDGVTYTWSSSPSGYSASGPSPVANPSVSTNYSVNSDLNGCTSSANVSVAISPLPVVDASSSSPVCSGSQLSLFGNNIASGQSSGNLFAWSGPDNFSSTNQNPTISSVTAASGGNYTLTITNQFGCVASSMISVDVSPLPQLNILSQTNLTCNGGSDGAFTIEVTNGSGIYQYDENGNSNFDGIFSGYPAGTYTVQVTDGNSCASSIPVTLTEPNPTTLPLAGSDQSVCFGSSATLSANTPEIGVGTWSVVSGSGNFANANDPSTTVSGLGAGQNVFSWTIENAICSVTNSDNVTVTTIPLPTAALSGSTNICSGGSANLTINFTGTAPWLYSINGGPQVSTTSNPETVVVNPTSTTSYNVTSVSDFNCTGTTSGTANIVVSTAPPAGSCTIATIPVNGCVSNVVTVSTNLVPGATGYTWSVPAGTLINGSSGPLTTVSNTVSITLGPLAPNSSGWEICSFAFNPCGQTNTNCKYIRGTLSMPSVISGSSVSCPNTSGIYSVNPVVGASSYNWTGTNGITFTGSGTSVTVNFPNGFTTGTICVNAQLPCGYTGPSRCLTITNGTPLLGAMNGNFIVCPGTNGVSYSVPPSAGANIYNWTLPSGATITSGAGTNSILVDFAAGFTGGNICVTAQSICGINSLPRCKTITSNKPATPGNITGPLAGVCGQTITYTVGTVPGATSYTWSAPAGATLSTPNGTNSIDVTFSNGFTTGNLCVTANNGCGASTARCIVVKGTPSTPATINGSAVVCMNESGDNYSIAPVFGATGYIWTVPANANIQSGQGTTSILVDWGTNGGVISVTATGICGNSGTKTLTVAMSCKISNSVVEGAFISAYPNPVRNTLTLQLENASSGRYASTIYDLSGRIVFTKEIHTTTGTTQSLIDVSTLNSGIYILEVTNSEGFKKQIRIAVE